MALPCTDCTGEPHGEFSSGAPAAVVRTGAPGTGDGESEADIVHIDRPAVPTFAIVRGLAPAAMDRGHLAQA